MFIQRILDDFIFSPQIECCQSNLNRKVAFMIYRFTIMKNYLLFVLLSLFTAYQTNAQVTVCLGTDTTVCTGQTVTINNCGGGGANPGGGIVLNNPTNITLSDDSWSGLIPMGFTFNFYGANYNNCVIGSNGIVSFNSANANGICPWSLNGTPIPTPSIASANNSAMIAYGDLNPSNANSGPIQYQTLGTAPNRMFVVLYNGVTMYSCTSQCVYAAYIFYETTNVVEMHIGSKTVCSTWNFGLAIEGTQNSTGAVATPVPGRNNQVWTANQDGRRWTPTAPNNTTNYTQAQISYVNVNSTGGQTQWQNTLGQTFPYNNGQLNVTQVPPGTTGYFLTGTSCGVSVGAVSDTTWITRITVNANATATTDYCNGGSGTATVTPTSGGSPFTYLWAPGGQTTQTATNLVAGNYTVTVTDANGCFKNVPVVVPNSTAAFSGTTTVVSCPGGSDGTATASMSPVLGTVSYIWYDAGGQTTQTATGLAAGTYHCEVSSSVGCVDTVEVVVTEIPPMVGQVVLTQDATCNSLNDGVVGVSVSGGTPQYSYSWDNSNSTLPVANDLYAGTHTVTVTDVNNCVITLTATIGEPSQLVITNLTPDQVICPENSTMLSVAGSGGSSPYTFTWSENGTVIGTGSTITVDPVNSGTQYCVRLSEQCGSPTTDSCMMITFPTPIVPSYVPDRTTSCQPGTFVFTNVSNNLNEIDSVEISFGDGEFGTVQDANAATHTYLDPGFYDMNVTVTSVFGCVYTGSFPQIVEVIAIPTAEFTMSANPTTIFETVIKMQDNSTPGVVNWQWTAQGASPMTSTSENPTFFFPEGVMGTYTVELIVETAEGCVDTVEHDLIVNSDILFYAPNSFTPDGDEFNQTWTFAIQGVDEYNFELLIFNRWGEIIWETHDINSAWDGTYLGKIVPTGTYTWVARVKDIYSDEKREFNGYINVLK